MRTGGGMGTILAAIAPNRPSSSSGLATTVCVRFDQSAASFRTMPSSRLAVGYHPPSTWWASADVEHGCRGYNEYGDGNGRDGCATPQQILRHDVGRDPRARVDSDSPEAVLALRSSTCLRYRRDLFVHGAALTSWFVWLFVQTLMAGTGRDPRPPPAWLGGRRARAGRRARRSACDTRHRSPMVGTEST